MFHRLLHVLNIGVSPDAKQHSSRGTCTCIAVHLYYVVFCAVDAGMSVVTGQHVVATATQLAKEQRSARGTTPSRPHPLPPEQLLVPKEEDDEVALVTIKQICQETLGRGVVSLEDIKEKVFLSQLESESAEDNLL